MKIFRFFQKVTFILFLSSLFIACEDVTDDKDVRFPLDKGNGWRYTVTENAFLVDSLGNQTVTYADTIDIFVFVLNDTTINGIPARKVTSVYNGKFGNGVQNVYYQEKEDGLYMIKFDSYYTFPVPKINIDSYFLLTSEGQPVSFAEFRRYALKLISGYDFTERRKQDEYTPFRTYAYPLKPGTEWIANDTGEGLIFTRKALKWTNRTAAGETFETLDIQFNVEPKDFIYVYDLHEYLSEKGIIRRDFYTEDINVTDEQGIYTGEKLVWSSTLELKEILTPR